MSCSPSNTLKEEIKWEIKDNCVLYADVLHLQLLTIIVLNIHFIKFIDLVHSSAEG